MGSKILVVDDEPDVANGWARALKLAHHDVVVSHTAKDALEISKSTPLDLVVLDYMMPEMTGIELLNEIRKDHPFIRSIIISGKIDSSVSEESVLAEIRTSIIADIYLHKPVENARLKDAVASLLADKNDKDWVAFANAKLEAPRSKKSVRATEKNLNKKRAKRKK